MKNRFVSLLMVGVLCCTCLFAKRVPVHIARWDLKKRSVDLPLSVSHEENIISIYSEVPLPDLNITILDLNGLVVYSDNISVEAGVEYMLPLEIGQGDYEIRIGDSFGYFSL